MKNFPHHAAIQISSPDISQTHQKNVVKVYEQTNTSQYEIDLFTSINS